MAISSLLERLCFMIKFDFSTIPFSLSKKVIEYICPKCKVEFECPIEMVLEFEDEALELISEKAIERKTGARGLRGIIEESMLDIMFEIPSRDDIEKCIITKETIENGAEPTLVLSDKKKRSIKSSANESVS